MPYDWLHLNPTDFYFFAVRKLFRQDPPALIVRLLDRNIQDNLGHACRYKMSVKLGRNVFS